MKKRFLLLMFFLPVLAMGQTITGTITGSGCVSANVQGRGTVGINVSGGSWTGTIQAQAVADPDANASTSNIQVSSFSTGTAQSTITANGDFSAAVAGASWFKLCGNTVTNTATVKITPVNLAGSVTGSTTDAATGTTGSPVPSKGHVIAGKNGSGNTTDVSVDASGNVNTNIVNTSNTGAVSITSNESGSVTLNGAGSVLVFVTSNTASAGTVNFQYSGDGVNFTAATLYPMPYGQSAGVTSFAVSGATAGQGWAANLAAGTTFQVTSSAVSGGTLLLQLTSSPAALTWPAGLTTAAGLSQVQITGWTSGSPIPSSAAGSALTATYQAVAAATNVKASTGNLFGWAVTNNAATACFLQFMNSAGTGTLGTNVFEFLVPATSTVTMPVGSFPVKNFTTGIAAGMSTTANGAVACGTAPDITVFYK